MSQADTAPDLVVVGVASRDLTADDPRGWRLGGSATYASLAAARLGVRVGCLVGVDDEAAQASELRSLEEAGVTLRPVPLARGPVFDNIEKDGRRNQRWASESDRIPVTSVPRGWGSARVWLLAPVAGELSVDWADVPRDEALVCVGWQGLLRRFDPDGRVVKVAPQPSPILSRASLVCASLDDLPPDSSIDDLVEFAPHAVLVLTGGAEGGLVAWGPAWKRGAGSPISRSFARYPPFAAQAVDPTGAGDVFMAALVAAWLLTGKLAAPAALRLAAAAGSCAVEGWGLAGVPRRDQVVARLSRRG